jgi:hypothetical protein
MSVDLTQLTLAALQAVPPTASALLAAPGSIGAVYLSADPLTTATLFAVALGVVCYVLNAVTGNCSFVDKLWSLVPWWYTIHFAVQPVLAGGALNERAALMAVLSVAWGLRLTYNFYRKDGYTWHGEDYRWYSLTHSLTPCPALPCPATSLCRACAVLIGCLCFVGVPQA